MNTESMLMLFLVPLWIIIIKKKKNLHVHYTCLTWFKSNWELASLSIKKLSVEDFLWRKKCQFIQVQSRKYTLGNHPDISEETQEREPSRSHAVLDKHEGEWSHCSWAILAASRMLAKKDGFMEVNRVGLSAGEQTLSVLHNLTHFHARPQVVYTCICTNPL